MLSNFLTTTIQLFHFDKYVPGSWKGTSTKFLMGLVGRLRVFSRIREAPSITCFRSSYMEPVTSNTKARVEALSLDPTSSSIRGTARTPCTLTQSANTRELNATPFIFKTQNTNLLHLYAGGKKHATISNLERTNKIPFKVFSFMKYNALVRRNRDKSHGKPFRAIHPCAKFGGTRA